MTTNDVSSRPKRAPDALANQIYGLLVVGAALAVARPGAQSRWSVFVDVVAAATVYSFAHIFANLLDRRTHAARALSGAERLEIATNGLLILRATGLPFVALLVCSIFRVGAGTSVTVALWLLVAELAITTWVASAAIRPTNRRALYALGATALGLVLILLKIVTH